MTSIGFNTCAVGIVILGAAWGWHKGFIRQIGSVAALLIAIAACRYAGPAFADAVGPHLGIEVHDAELSKKFTVALCYIIQFIVIYIAVRVIAGVLRKVVHTVLLGPIDSLAGAALTGFEFLLALSIVVNVWIMFAADCPAAAASATSPLGFARDFAPWLLGVAGF